jgi:hypothetical protein
MATFTVTYTLAPGGATLDLAPAGAAFSLSGDAIDRIEIVNAAGTDITIEAIPETCSAFEKSGDLMHFTVKSGDKESFKLRSDLDGAFSPADSNSDLNLFWNAKGSNGAVDDLGTNPSMFVPRITISA